MLDLCWAGPRSRPDSGRAAAGGVPVRAGLQGRRHIRVGFAPESRCPRDANCIGLAGRRACRFVAPNADDFLQFAALGVKGASVTIPPPRPFKCADEVDELSLRAGAVNTLRLVDGRWIGRNTDVSGFLAPLSGILELKGTRATILGAGGAARAVAVALATAGASVTVHARNESAGEELARLAGGRALTLSPAPRSWDLLVNATPVGMYPQAEETPFHGVFDGKLVYDLVYNPLRTRLLREAGADGCATIGGLLVRKPSTNRSGDGPPPPRGPCAMPRWLAWDSPGGSAAMKLTTFDTFTELAQGGCPCRSARRSSPTC